VDIADEQGHETPVLRQGRPSQLPSVLEKLPLPNVVLATTETVLNWARSRSTWPLTYGLACCAIEMMATGMPQHDMGRFGVELFRPSPRQADLMIVSGTVSLKMGPRLRRLWEQMAVPKWVIAMGDCATSGGEFWDSYHTVQGVDTIVPVDVYVPGCPPRPEALLDGVMRLREKIQKAGFYRPVELDGPSVEAIMGLAEEGGGES